MDLAEFIRRKCDLEDPETHSALARVAELEAQLAAWRFRFPNLEYVSKIDGIQQKH